MPAGALLAGVVEQPLRDVLPGRAAAIQSDCIGRLDFDYSLAAAAGHAEDVALNVGKTSLPDLGCGRAGARIFEHRVPVFGRKRCIRSRSGRCWPAGCLGGQLFHLLRGRHAPGRGSTRSRACGSVRSCIQPCSSHSRMAPTSWRTWIAHPRSVRVIGLRSLIISIAIDSEYDESCGPSFVPAASTRLRFPGECSASRKSPSNE
ncbi:hypothetical protein ACVILK_003483 [Bradyrhizobium embrapense]